MKIDLNKEFQTGPFELNLTINLKSLIYKTITNSLNNIGLSGYMLYIEQINEDVYIELTITENNNIITVPIEFQLEQPEFIHWEEIQYQSMIFDGLLKSIERRINELNDLLNSDTLKEWDDILYKNSKNILEDILNKLHPEG